MLHCCRSRLVLSSPPIRLDTWGSRRRWHAVRISGEVVACRGWSEALRLRGGPLPWVSADGVTADRAGLGDRRGGVAAGPYRRRRRVVAGARRSRDREGGGCGERPAGGGRA